MSDPTTFADMLSDFNDQYTEFQDDAWGAVDKIVGMLNGAAGSFGKFLDDVLPGGGTVDKAIDKWNNELYPAIRDGMQEIQDKLQQAVNDLNGAPVELQSYAEAFVRAHSDLYKQRGTAELATRVSSAWSGPAHDMYATVATEQTGALQSLADALTKGGELTSAAANKILELWRKLIYEFASFGTDLLNLLASATDASKIVSFEVPTIIEACAAVWQKVVNITDLLLEFMISQGTTDALNWISIAEGAAGLPGNEWPPISESASDDMNDPGKWNVKTG